MTVLSAWCLLITAGVMFLSAVAEVNRAYRLEARQRAESTILHCVGQRLVVWETRTLGTVTDCEMYVVKPAKLIVTEATNLFGKADIRMVEPDDPRIADAAPANPNPEPPPIVVPSGRT